ncbi:MAG: hypothetical protein LC135_16345 [Phycisphaerae bacterium]|jgi:hypothetical protein|nr:hypothetical protein [Phycisphaerae bacterium]
MSQATMTPTADGESCKLDAHALPEARREVYVLRGRRALLARLLDAAEATANDVRDVVEVRDEINPVCLGVVPGSLARAGIIERVGFAESRRPDAHARPVSIWRLADRAAALGWLAVHPDRPDPTPAEADAAPSLFD